MKKLFVIPVMLICMSGTPSSRIETIQEPEWHTMPVSTRVDSINVKAVELGYLLEQVK